MIDYPQNGMIWGYRTGDRVSVLHDRLQPDNGPRSDTLNVLWFGTGMRPMLGAVFSGVGLSRASGNQAFKVGGLEG